MFLECEKFNPKNKNYLVETIGHKLQYVIYCFTTLFIAKLICLANIPTPDNISSRVETHFHLFSLLVHWSKLKKKNTTHAVYYNCWGLCQRSMEAKSVYYWTYRWISGIHVVVIPVVSLNTCYLFLFNSVTCMK